MSVLPFVRPARLVIVGHAGLRVILNDRGQTHLVYDAKDRVKARRVLKRLNDYHASHPGASSVGPYRLIPLTEEQ